MEHKGAFNTITFSLFLLKSSMPRGSVILIDNCSFHHSLLVKEVASLKGWTLLFTLPYSPWFNPIEGMFSIVKRAFYKQQQKSIRKAFECMTEQKAKRFFEHSLKANHAGG